MVNMIIILSRLDYCFGSQDMTSMDCLDLYIILIIFLTGRVISLASLNCNYNGRHRGKMLSKCTSQIVLLFVHTSSYTHTHTLTHTLKHTDSSQPAETSLANTITYNVGLI